MFQHVVEHFDMRLAHHLDLGAVVVSEAGRQTAQPLEPFLGEVGADVLRASPHPHPAQPRRGFDDVERESGVLRVGQLGRSTERVGFKVSW